VPTAKTAPSTCAACIRIGIGVPPTATACSSTVGFAGRSIV
jgi:hypothetical protein